MPSTTGGASDMLREARRRAVLEEAGGRGCGWKIGRASTSLCSWIAQRSVTGEDAVRMGEVSGEKKRERDSAAWAACEVEIDRARPTAASSSDPVPILTRPRSAGGCVTAKSWDNSLSPAKRRITEMRVEQELEVRRGVRREGGASGRSAHPRTSRPPVHQSILSKHEHGPQEYAVLRRWLRGTKEDGTKNVLEYGFDDIRSS